MGADNQAARVIERMEREEMLVAAAIRFLRLMDAEWNPALSEQAYEALVNLRRVLETCGYRPPKDWPES